MVKYGLQLQMFTTPRNIIENKVCCYPPCIWSSNCCIKGSLSATTGGKVSFPMTQSIKVELLMFTIKIVDGRLRSAI